VDLFEELDEVQGRASTGGTRCRVAEALDLLDEADRDDFERALADRNRYTNPTVAEVLAARSGLRVTRHSVGGHRRRDCTCEQ